MTATATSGGHGWLRTAAPPVLVLVYGALFLSLYRLLGPGTESLATFVVLIVASMDGLARGLGVAGACLVTHAVLGAAFLDVPWTTWLQGGQLATTVALPLVGAVVGRLRDLHRRLDQEVVARQRKEAELVQAHTDAETANRAKGDFLARMSHEIRTPMHGVLGATQILIETPLSGEQRQYVDMIQGSGELLLAVINDILDFSKIAAGHMELENIEFELQPVLKETLEMATLAAKRKGLHVSLDVPADLPEWVCGDPIRLRQILINLLGNAAKFTDRGHITLRARFLPMSDKMVRLRIEVQDTGVGIADKTLSGLFQPFTQADASTTRVYGGTGLGLAISSQLVQLMGGELKCNSMLGRGSTFYFELEMPLPEEVATAPAETTQHEVLQPVTGRVLLAEDNKINQVIATRLLEALGVDVDVVGDGAGAVAAAAKRRYDVILLDCQMPVMDGFSAAEHIRAAEPPGQRVPMLAITASILESDHERAKIAGVDGVLLKPLRAEELRRAVARYLPKRSRTSQALELRPAPVELPTLDVAMLADLKKAAGLKTVHSVVGAFEDAAAETNNELVLASGQPQELVKIAHRHRGSASCVGARRLAASLAQLEAIATSGSEQEIKEAIARCLHESDEALAILSRYRNADSAAFALGPAPVS